MCATPHSRDLVLYEVLKTLRYLALWLSMNLLTLLLITMLVQDDLANFALFHIILTLFPDLLLNKTSLYGCICYSSTNQSFALRRDFAIHACCASNLKSNFLMILVNCWHTVFSSQCPAVFPILINICDPNRVLILVCASFPSLYAGACHFPER